MLKIFFTILMAARISVAADFIKQVNRTDPSLSGPDKLPGVATQMTFQMAGSRSNTCVIPLREVHIGTPMTFDKIYPKPLRRFTNTFGSTHLRIDDGIKHPVPIRVCSLH